VLIVKFWHLATLDGKIVESLAGFMYICAASFWKPQKLYPPNSRNDDGIFFMSSKEIDIQQTKLTLLAEWFFL